MVQTFWALPAAGLSAHTAHGLRRRPVSVAIPNADSFYVMTIPILNVPLNAIFSSYLLQKFGRIDHFLIRTKRTHTMNNIIATDFPVEDNNLIKKIQNKIKQRVNPKK